MSEHHPPSVSPGTLKKLLWALYALSAAALLAELFFEKHGHYGWEGWFGFHAGYGFLAFLFIVFAGAGLRKLISRPEVYYPEDAPEDGGSDDDHGEGAA